MQRKLSYENPQEGTRFARAQAQARCTRTFGSCVIMSSICDISLSKSAGLPGRRRPCKTMPAICALPTLL
jgi:hypothetical protein